MALYALSDLHLSFYRDKKMDQFGDIWKKHDQKIKYNWQKTVKVEDTVILSGDISWAMTLEEAAPDLAFIDQLPGKKVIHSGNHDYWWASTAKLNTLYDSIFFMKNSFFPYGSYAICGSRGWLCPGDSRYTSKDEKIYLREINRMAFSIESAKNKGYEKIILSMHFPPTNDQKEYSGFMKLIDTDHIEKVIYGHLHGENSFSASIQGSLNGVEYILASGDYLNFKPKLVLSN